VAQRTRRDDRSVAWATAIRSMCASPFTGDAHIRYPRLATFARPRSTDNSLVNASRARADRAGALAAGAPIDPVVRVCPRRHLRQDSSLVRPDAYTDRRTCYTRALAAEVAALLEPGQLERPEKWLRRAREMPPTEAV
jgi:hypothetical protein